MKIPATFDECAALSRDALLLDAYLRARLVELTKQDSAVAVRAIELIRDMGTPSLFGSELNELTSEQINRLELFLGEWIRDNT